ncbi:MAG: prolipoprotein diacylglyceryl transferase [Oscillospiraceae bacterium]|nr:prolipoprotein diacylglyceryl transferase [Oscillospiraceae bacterium]
MTSVLRFLPLLEEAVLETIQRDSVISFPGLGIFGLNPPASFSVFGHRIYFYGVLFALGFTLGILYCARRSKDFGLKSDDFYDMVILLIPLSILCARIYFVLFRLDEFAGRPLIAYFAVWEGGIAIYGGIIGGILAIWLVTRRKKLPFLAMLDLTVFGVLIGQIIGRWGNFMNREAFGGQTEIFCRMGLTNPSGHTIYVHPTFLYESLWNLVLFLGLWLWVKQGKRKYDGQMSLLYLFFYGLGRAWIEGLRTDSLYIGHTGIRVSQALSLVLVLFAGALLLWERRREHPASELWVNRVKAAEEGKQNEEQATQSGK